MVVQMENTGAKAKPGISQVAAVADVDFVDLVEEVIGCVAREDIGQAGIHAHPDQGQAPGRLPFARPFELLVGELHAGEAERVVGVRP